MTALLSFAIQLRPAETCSPQASQVVSKLKFPTSFGQSVYLSDVYCGLSWTEALCDPANQKSEVFNLFTSILILNSNFRFFLFVFFPP